MPIRSRALGLIAAVLAASAWLVPASQAQSDRMTYEGTFAYPGYIGRNERPQNATAVAGEPYIAFRARYVHQSWSLIGTPVHSCDIRWEYTDHQGQPTSDTVTVLGLELDLSDPDVRFALETHPGIVRVGAAPTGSSFVEIRLEALSSAPSVYDLDFLVPLDTAAQAPMREGASGDDTDAQMAVITASQARTRCLSGALGRAGGDGFNTPYAFDTDALLVYPENSTLSSGPRIQLEVDGVRMGYFVDADTATQAFNNVVLRRTHDRAYEASGSSLYLIDAEFNLVSAVAFVRDILRSAARAAEGARRESEARQAEAARRAEAARASAAPASRMSTASRRTFEEARFDPDNPPERSVETLIDSIDRRFEAVLEATVSAPPAPSTGSASQPVFGDEMTGYVRFDAASDDLDALRRQEERLAAAAARFERYADALEPPAAPRDLSALSPPDAQTRAEEIVGLLAQCAFDSEDVGDGSGADRVRSAVAGDVFRVDHRNAWRPPFWDQFIYTMGLDDLYRSIASDLVEVRTEHLTFHCDDGSECVDREWTRDLLCRRGNGPARGMDCVEADRSRVDFSRSRTQDHLRVPCNSDARVRTLLAVSP